MIDISCFIIPLGLSVVDAMAVIDRGGKGIAFVCADGCLVGALSDGDVRRYILRGGDLSAPIDSIVVQKCIKVTADNAYRCSGYFAQYSIKAIPVVDRQNILQSICFDNKAFAGYEKKLNASVVIMAGGKGTRLYPYTKVLPKPLIPINDVPITELIIERFRNYGCENFYMIVNHQRNMIKAYFSESILPYTLSFIDEDTPLGTGGGLKLLTHALSETFFFSNCDTLIDVDFNSLYSYHKESGNIVTMVCATKNVIIPYGTVTVGHNGEVCAMEEKPRYSFLINTGLYVLEPSILDHIPDGTFIHITDIIARVRAVGERVGVFPISESQWSDIGQKNGLFELQAKKTEEL